MFSTRAGQIREDSGDEFDEQMDDRSRAGDSGWSEHQGIFDVDGGCLWDSSFWSAGRTPSVSRQSINPSIQYKHSTENGTGINPNGAAHSASPTVSPSGRPVTKAFYRRLRPC
jgi:hypothetical protein